MKRGIIVLGCWLVLIALLGCGAGREEMIVASGSSVAPNVKIKVVDVANNTGELFDVDVIGLLWSGLDGALKQQGLLWTESSPVPPLRLEASIIRYQKGNLWLRNVLPPWGKTLLVVKGDLKQEGRVVASVEARRTISIGREGFTLSAWKKIFEKVAEDMVNELVQKL